MDPEIEDYQFTRNENSYKKQLQQRLNRRKDIYRQTNESPVKTLALYQVERDNILDNMENKNVLDADDTKYAGEKLEIKSKQFTKETKAVNAQEI